jgi:hypothetical protein
VLAGQRQNPIVIGFSLVCLCVLPEAGANAQTVDQAVIMAASTGVRGAIAPSSSWMPVGNNTLLHAGDSLKTSENSKAFLLFGSGAKLVLGPSSILRLQDLGQLGARILTGAVRLSAPPASLTRLVAGPLQIDLTNAEAIVERHHQTWRVTMLAGQATVINTDNPDGRKATVLAGTVNAWDAKRLTTTGLMGVQYEDFQSFWALPQAPEPPGAIVRHTPPWLAAGLSAVLPGTGQLYAGALWPGLAHLGLNGALLGLGVYAQSMGQSNVVLGCGAGMLALNVYSAWDAFGVASVPLAQ